MNENDLLGLGQPAKSSPKKGWKITFNSPVILVFAALCLVATILNTVTGGATNRAFFMTYHSSLADPMTYVRFFTHTIGHAGWEHLVGNMAYVLLLGPLLEEKYGSGPILGVMAVTALSTALVNYFFFPRVALCGASGIVFAFILLASVTSMRDGEVPLTFILVAVIFLGQQIVTGIFVPDNVSNLSHIIGGVVGGIAGFAMCKRT